MRTKFRKRDMKLIQLIEELDCYFPNYELYKHSMYCFPNPVLGENFFFRIDPYFPVQLYAEDAVSEMVERIQLRFCYKYKAGSRTRSGKGEPYARITTKASPFSKTGK